MSESQTSPLIPKFCNVWAESFAGVLKSLGVVSPASVASEPQAAAALSAEEISKSVAIRFSGGGALKGELLWVAENPVALQLAQLLMSEPPDPAVEFTETHRDAFAEFLRQVAGQTATAWNQEVGAETEIVFQSAAVPAHVHAQSSSLRLTGEKFAEVTIRLLLNEELCAALAAAPPPPTALDATSSETESSEAEPVLASASDTAALPANIELLLDVELEATIRFGERELHLRDIFGLMPGAVVELNQMLNQPAELLVAGRLVARGEVVVVDGNFGLRVTEVASAGQRAAALQL